MTILAEYTAVLRDELGKGYESATLATLMRAYVRQALKPKVLARRKASLDDSRLVAAREAVEQILQREVASRKAAEEATMVQLDKDLEGF